MNLADWLSREKIKRVEFAARIGVTPQSITGYCDGDFWPKKEIAQRIFEATGGEVTPVDFMLTPKKAQA